MPVRSLSSVLQASQQKTPPDRSITARWKNPKLFDKGFVAVPSRFLQLYARLKPFPLSAGEALFVLHLMEFKWDDSAPFPGYKTIASRMGVSDKMTRKYAQSLETKKYLQRERRVGQTNKFDLTLLFDALTKAADEEAKTQARSKKRKQAGSSNTDALVAWLAGQMDAYNFMADKDKKELADWQAKNLGASSSDWPGWERYLGPRPK